MKQCPNCNGNFSDEQLFCPECGLKLEDVRSEPEPPPQEDSEHETSRPAQRSNGLVIFLAILLAAAVIAMGHFYSELTYERDMREFDKEFDNQQMQSVRNELYDVQSELDKLSDLVGVYGYASEDFYAGKSVIVLEVGETKDIPIYMYGDVFDNPGQVWAWWDDLISNQFSVEWAEWSEPNCQNLNITGVSPGYAIIKLAFLDYLYDDLTDSELDALFKTLPVGDNVFEVLVIVTG